MNFWIVFALFGAIGIPGLVMVFGFGEDWKSKLFGTGVVLVIWFTLAVGSYFGADVNADKWNDGYCQCGTHWELRGASQYRSSHTKYYVCPECHAEIEINY